MWPENLVGMLAILSMHEEPEDGIYVAKESTDEIHCIMVTWESERIRPGFPQWIIIDLSVLNCSIVIYVQFNRSVVSDSLRPHESQHARPPCPSPTPRVY